MKNKSTTYYRKTLLLSLSFLIFCFSFSQITHTISAAAVPQESSHSNTNTYTNLNTITNTENITFTINYNTTGNITWYKDGAPVKTDTGVTTSTVTTAWTSADYGRVKEMRVNSTTVDGTSTDTVWNVEVQETGTATITKSESDVVVYVTNGWANFPSIYLAAKQEDNTWIEYVSAKTYLVRRGIFVSGATLNIDYSTAKDIRLQGKPCLSPIDYYPGYDIKAINNASVHIDGVNFYGWDVIDNKEMPADMKSAIISSYGDNDLDIKNSNFRHVFLHYDNDNSGGDVIEGNTFFEGLPRNIQNSGDPRTSGGRIFKNNIFRDGKTDNFYGEGYGVTLENNKFFAKQGSSSLNVRVGGGARFVGNEEEFSGWDNVVSFDGTSFAKDNNLHDNGGNHNGFDGVASGSYLTNNYCHHFTGFNCFFVQFGFSPSNHIYWVNNYAKESTSGMTTQGLSDEYVYNYTADTAGTSIVYKAEHIVFRKSNFWNVNSSALALADIGDTAVYGFGYVRDVYVIDSIFRNNREDYRIESDPSLNNHPILYSINSIRKNDDGSIEMPLLQFFGSNNGEGRNYAYLDVLAQDQTGSPISGAIITVEALTDANYPAVKVILPPPLPLQPDQRPVGNPPIPTVETLDNVQTGANGHAPLPNYGWSTDPEPTLGLLFHKHTTSGINTNYQYRITATYNSKTVSKIVTPDASWLRENPTITPKTVVLTFDKEEGKSALNVNSGTGSGLYTPAQVVNISANTAPSGKVFDRWIGDTTGITNVNSASTTLTVQAADASVTPYYKDITYHLTVIGGTGSGDYAAGQMVAIDAPKLSGNLKFYEWTGTGLSSVVSPDVYSSILNMPSANVTVTANYRDVSTNTYHLEVVGGSGSGYYNVGDEINIVANPVEGQVLWKWNWFGDSIMDDPFSAHTVLTMPSYDIYLPAINITDPSNPASHALTVTSGTGTGSYAAAAQVTVTAATPLPGQVFDRWTGDTTYLSNANVSTATVTMPAGAVNLTATYRKSVLNTYDLTITNGSGSGSYAQGAQASITAQIRETGLTFDKWTGDTQYVNNINASTTTVTMPASPINLTATYKFSLFALNISGGSGSGLYPAGQEVTITASTPPQGKLFDKWDGALSSVSNINANTTTVTMPDRAVNLSATYSDNSAFHTLTVTNGTGSGSYTPASQITIVANPAASGKTFDRWTGSTAYVNDISFATATVTMPGSAISLTATYKDADMVATPTFSPAAGTYTSAQTITITSTPGAAIHYTTNGNTPTASSSLYSAPLTFSATTTLKAIATKTNYADSAIASAVYTINIPSSGGGGGGGSSSGGSSGGTPSLTPTIIKTEIKSITGSTVVLTLSVTNATHMLLSDSPTFTNSSWQSYSPTPTYIKKDQQTKLYLKFKSSSNTISPIVTLTIPATPITPLPPTSDTPYPTGTLLKLNDSFKVYVIIEGKKKWISTPEVFQQLGYQWTEIKVITDTELNQLPDYEDNLIRAINDYKVYLVVNGVKRHIPNPIIFLDYGFKWNEVKDVPQSTIDKYKPTYLIKQSGSNGIYYVNPQEIRKLIPNTEVFNSYNDKNEDIQIISKTEMDFYPLSNLIKLTNTNDIYLIEGNIKKRIPTPQVFNKYKLNWNLVMSVNQTEFNFYQDGGELR